jgi:hypothetical protein
MQKIYTLQAGRGKPRFRAFCVEKGGTLANFLRLMREGLVIARRLASGPLFP